MNPFTHADTIPASSAIAEAVPTRTKLLVDRSFLSREAIGGSWVCPAVRNDTSDSDVHSALANLSPDSPKEITMSSMYTGHVFDPSDASEVLPIDEVQELALEVTTAFEVDNEIVLVGRPIVEVSTPATIEAQDELASSFAKRTKSAEKLAEQTGEPPISEQSELTDLEHETLDLLAGFHASEDVMETIESETNFGLTVLEKVNADAYLTLTLGDSSCFELTMHNATGWKLLAFAKALRDFSAYDLQACPEMQLVADSLTSTGRLLDSHGFEAIVWEDDHNSAFVRHCVNVAQALKFDLYFDRRAQKACNRLTVKRAPGVSNKVIIVSSIVADKTPEVIRDSAVRLTGVYAYEAPEAAPAEAKTEVKAVSVKEVSKPVITFANPGNQEEKVAKKTKPAEQAKKKNGVSEVTSPDGQNVVILPDLHVPADAQAVSVRPRLSASDEVTTKVVRMAMFGVIVQDAFGNEGFLGFREKGAAGRGGVDHERLVVKVDDEIKVKVVSVAANGFAKVTLLNVVDPINHYLSCLRVGDVQLGLVMRRRSEHCFYVTLGGPIDGILAVRDIPNLAEVKDKLRPNNRLGVRINSVNPDKRNFHVVIDSFPSSTN